MKNKPILHRSKILKITLDYFSPLNEQKNNNRIKPSSRIYLYIDKLYI